MPSAPSIVRPAVAALVLLAAVALTGLLLFTWWPGGVAIGVAVGAGAVLAVGAQMQRSNARVPTDDAFVERLGIPARTSARRVERVAAPAAPKVPVTVPAVAPLQARQDDAWFSSGSDARLEREPEPAADVEPEPQPVAAAAPVAEPVAAPVDDDGPDTIPATDFVLTDDRTAPADLGRLKDELGEDSLDFARAARLVVETQYASAARLQRDLDVPYSRARRLLSDLEERHFVGPATGSLPRIVLMPKERLPEVERLLEEVRPA